MVTVLIQLLLSLKRRACEYLGRIRKNIWRKKGNKLNRLPLSVLLETDLCLRREKCRRRRQIVGHMPKWGKNLQKLSNYQTNFQRQFKVSTLQNTAWNTDDTWLSVHFRASKLDVASQFGLTTAEAAARGYEFENNPDVKVWEFASSINL